MLPTPCAPSPPGCLHALPLPLALLVLPACFCVCRFLFFVAPAADWRTAPFVCAALAVPSPALFSHARITSFARLFIVFTPPVVASSPLLYAVSTAYCHHLHPPPFTTAAISFVRSENALLFAHSVASGLIEQLSASQGGQVF